MEIIHYPECAEIIELLFPLTELVRVETGHWINTPDGVHVTNDGPDFCYDCARAIVRHLRRADRKRRSQYILDGGWTIEHDTLPVCAACQVRIRADLTTEGALYELDHFRENQPEASDAYEVSEMLSAFKWSRSELAEFAREAIAIGQALVARQKG